MVEWIHLILDPEKFLNISNKEIHLFQVFVFVACDLLSLSRNKAQHESTIPEAISLAKTVGKIFLEHHSTWRSKTLPPPVERWTPPPSNAFTINFDTFIM
jgi:hypothetical protein